MSAKQYPKAQRDRAVRMVLDRLDEYQSVYIACGDVAPKLGIHRESLRRWVKQALVDNDVEPGVKTVERQRIKELENEVRDLREANEILRAASVFFARELDPHRR